MVGRYAPTQMETAAEDAPATRGPSVWVEVAREAIALVLVVALAVIGVMVYLAIKDAASDADRLLTYVQGGFAALIAVGVAVGLYIGTRAFD